MGGKMPQENAPGGEATGGIAREELARAELARAELACAASAHEKSVREEPVPMAAPAAKWVQGGAGNAGDAVAQITRRAGRPGGGA